LKERDERNQENEKKAIDNQNKAKEKEENKGSPWYDDINDCYDRLLDGITAYKYNYTNNYVKKVKLELDVGKTKLMYREIE